MAHFKSMFAALALAFSTLAIVAPVAAAQGTTVVVIDQQRIMRDSRGGKDIIQKITNIESSMQRELEPTAKSLESEGKSIEARTANMTREAMAADSALRTTVQAYAKKAQDFNVRRQKAAADLQYTERKAWAEFFEALQPALKEVVTEKRAQIIVDKSQAVYADPAIDVTALVITKMDSRKPTVNVTRQSAPTR